MIDQTRILKKYIYLPLTVQGVCPLKYQNKYCIKTGTFKSMHAPLYIKQNVLLRLNKINGEYSVYQINAHLIKFASLFLTHETKSVNSNDAILLFTYEYLYSL